MKKIAQKIFLILVFGGLFLVSGREAAAVCPVCTVAVGAGLGLCRFLGIDDTVSGIWIGGLILSSGLWLADFLKKKNWQIKYLDFWSVVFFGLMVVLPLVFMGLIGLPANKLWGIDKLLLGMGVGAGVFLLGVWADKFLRRKNNGKVYIYYQKVILPVLFLTIASFIFYQLTC
jgi:hypothetical protein